MKSENDSISQEKWLKEINQPSLKTTTIREYAFSQNKKQAFYQGQEIIDCGVSGQPKHYWVITLNEKTNMFETHTLHMTKPVRVVL